MTVSSDLYARALKVIPGGVNSPVRSFRSVGGDPFFVQKASGAYLYSADGQRLTDFCCSWGPLILGHAHPQVLSAVSAAASRGTSFGACHEMEVEMAELICSLVPSADMVRMVSSGTEASMTALRLARAVTGRSRIVKFSGCYHGHHDALLVEAGSGLLSAGVQTSAGIPSGSENKTLVLPYNDWTALKLLESEDDIACIIAEPVAGNMGLVVPEDEYLKELRVVADRIGAILIFDEVISGFRFHAGAYSQLCGVDPDLTCFGKIIGGGLPVGAVAGRADVMNRLAPVGDVYQAGTLSGNPVAVAAGLETIEILCDTDPYEGMALMVSEFSAAFNSYAVSRDLPIHCTSKGSCFTLFCRRDPVRNLADAKACDGELYAKIFHSLLKAGVYIPPSPFETAFISTAHTSVHLDELLSVLCNEQFWDIEMAQLGGAGNE